MFFVKLLLGVNTSKLRQSLNHKLHKRLEVPLHLVDADEQENAVSVHKTREPISALWSLRGVQTDPRNQVKPLTGPGPTALLFDCDKRVD